MNNTTDIPVTVYCATFNHERYIRKALDGFVSQVTDFNYEVIVHDDASTDGTADIVREYADRYPDLIRPILQTENQYSQGINIFMTHVYPIMRGRYIATCEGDDYWTDPYKLQKQFDALESHPECSIAVHRVSCCNEDGSPRTDAYPGPAVAAVIDDSKSGVIDRDKLLRILYIKASYPFQTCCYFYRREVLDVPLTYPRDIGLLRKCFITGLFYYISDTMSTRRRFSKDSFTSKMRYSTGEWLVKQNLSEFNGEKAFDALTDYAYHDYVLYSCLRLILSIARFDLAKAKELLNEDLEGYMAQRSALYPNLNNKGKLNYLVFFYLAPLYPAYRAVINGVRKMKKSINDK